jgi:hypothetical protein
MMADVAEARFDCRTCCPRMTAGLSRPSSEISTAARYSSVSAIQRCPAGFAHNQRASTTLSESHALAFKQGVRGVAPLFALVKGTFASRRKSQKA